MTGFDTSTYLSDNFIRQILHGISFSSSNILEQLSGDVKIPAIKSLSKENNKTQFKMS